jgi:hypothetical protein
MDSPMFDVFIDSGTGWRFFWSSDSASLSAEVFAMQAFWRESMYPDPSYLVNDVKEGSVLEHKNPHDGISWALVSSTSPRFHSFV